MFGYFWVGLGGSDMYRVFLIVDGCRSIGVPRGEKNKLQCSCHCCNLAKWNTVIRVDRWKVILSCHLRRFAYV